MDTQSQTARILKSKWSRLNGAFQTFQRKVKELSANQLERANDETGEAPKALNTKLIRILNDYSFDINRLEIECMEECKEILKNQLDPSQTNSITIAAQDQLLMILKGKSCRLNEIFQGFQTKFKVSFQDSLRTETDEVKQTLKNKMERLLNGYSFDVIRLDIECIDKCKASMSSQLQSGTDKAICKETCKAEETTSTTSKSTSFHQKRSESSTVSNQEDPSKLHCICRKPDTGIVPMIRCNFCSEWYHPSCIGFEISSKRLRSATSVEFKCLQCDGEDYKLEIKDPSPIIKGYGKRSIKRDHQCTICDGSFPRGCDLMRHIRNKHNGYPFPCPKAGCRKKFKYKIEFQQHIRSVHQVHPKTSSINGKRKYQCKTCGKKLKTKWNLRQHELVHEQERPFPCDVCGKRFVNGRRLQHHPCKGQDGFGEILAEKSKSVSTESNQETGANKMAPEFEARSIINHRL